MALPEPAHPDRIAELAQSMVAGTVYLPNDVDEHTRMVMFLPWTLGEWSSSYTPEELKQIVVFGDTRTCATGESSINGYPIFLEVKVWRVEDVEAAARKAVAALAILSGKPGA